jgi:pyruvate/2-oxoglutarate dehydrogenase complex dihydrolipoamide dehydrogenase (E3) component
MADRKGADREVDLFVIGGGSGGVRAVAGGDARACWLRKNIGSVAPV